MARCDQCNKFVPYEPGDIDMELNVELSLDEENKPSDAQITGNVRLLLTCGECGQEMAEANVDIDTYAHLDHKEASEHELELEDESGAVEAAVPS